MKVEPRAFKRALVGVFVMGASALLGPVASAAPPRSTGNPSVDACIAASEAGQVERTRGHLRAAHAAFSRCLAAECPALISKDCNDFLAQVDAQMPTVVFRVLDTESGRDVVEAEVRIDGDAMMRIDGRVRALDPGPHDVDVRASGYTTVAQRVVAEEGVKSRLIEIRLTKVGARGTVGTGDPSTSKPPGPSPASSAASGSTNNSPSTGTLVTSVTLGGLGLVALGTFGAIALGADADYRTLQDSCGTRCAPNEVDDLRGRYQIADIALAVGLASLAGAALVYLFGPRDRQDEAKAAHGVGRVLGGVPIPLTRWRGASRPAAVPPLLSF